MSKQSRMVLMVACTALASQVYMNMFYDGFTVNLSVVVMAIFLYIFKDLNPVRCGLCISIFSPLSRFISMMLKGGVFLETFRLCIPDVGFFLAYTIWFGILFNRLGYAPYQNFYIRIALCDFLSNVVEMTIRFAIFKSVDLTSFINLLIVAIIRSFLIVLICIGADSYKTLLEKVEHEANYKKLVLMASTFSSEVYFMQKNMNEIEDIMTDSFGLYRDLKDNEYPTEYQTRALSIAKDIHEVKKGYRRVIKGIQENFLSDIERTPLSLQEIFKILKTDVDNSIEMTKANVSFSYTYETNYMIEKHFAFMSILRNLISNSLDEFMKTPQRRGVITVVCKDIVEDGRMHCQISVTDNGPGIPDDFLDVLFTPGFSTKYDETGDQNRGLGLTLVKDLIEEEFNGGITVRSSRHGACFILRIPVSAFVLNSRTMQGEQHGDHLHS